MSNTEPDSSEIRISAHFLRLVNSNTAGGLEVTVWAVCGGRAVRDMVVPVDVVGRWEAETMVL